MNSALRPSPLTRYTCAALAASLLFVGACAGKRHSPGAETEAENAAPARVSTAVKTVPIAQASKARYPLFGDLGDILQRGVLRVVQPDFETSGYFARAGRPSEQDRDLLTRFAEAEKLKIEWIVAPPGTSLTQIVAEGHADIAAANITVTPDRKKRVAFTVPLGQVREVLVTRKGDKRLGSLAGLNGRTVVVKRTSTYWATAAGYQSHYPKMKIVEAPAELSTFDILERVASGEYDLTIADDNLFTVVQAYQPLLHRRFTLTGERAVAWAVRLGSDQLLEALDRFLHDTQLSRPVRATLTGDLPEIRKRQVLRVLTRNDPVTYFLWRGELVGFEYDLVRRLAADLGLRVEMIVAPSQAELIPWLKEGRGDLIAASLTITEERARQGIRFSRPYLSVAERLVGRAGEKDISALKEIRKRRVIAHRSSAYWPRLEKLREEAGFELVAASKSNSTREMIDWVAEGKYDFTVADSHILESELAWRSDVRAVYTLSDSAKLGWALRAADTKLKAAVDGFLAREYRGLYYNITRDKYFGARQTGELRGRLRVEPGSRLSPYDDLIRKYAEQYDFDWRLIAAQMYRESRFNPKARSFAGAYGLMQLMPRTAQSLGIRKTEEPEGSIHAGVKYLASLRDRLPRELPLTDRMWFALASYNAGHGHVTDARTLARQRGLHPDRWFGHVEQTMLLLSRPEFSAKARHGYVRGSEPVGYVREIRDYHQAYVQAGY